MARWTPEGDSEPDIAESVEEFMETIGVNGN